MNSCGTRCNRAGGRARDRSPSAPRPVPVGRSRRGRCSPLLTTISYGVASTPRRLRQAPEGDDCFFRCRPSARSLSFFVLMKAKTFLFRSDENVSDPPCSSSLAALPFTPSDLGGLQVLECFKIRWSISARETAKKKEKKNHSQWRRQSHSAQGIISQISNQQRRRRACWSGVLFDEFR